MRTFSAIVADVCLFLGTAALLVGGAVFTLLFFFPLLLLALAGVLTSFDDRTVRERYPALDQDGWRGGS
jgi:hypothetical protein